MSKNTRRPFFNDSIEKLEAYFEDRLKDKDFLQLLYAELCYRSTQRAIKLRDRVENALRLTTENTTNVPSSTIHTPLIESNIETVTTIPTSNSANNILAAWTALEVLSPQTFRQPKDLASNGDPRLIVSFDKGRLPWEGGGEKSRPNYRLYYQVVIGTVNFQKAISSLLEIYADNRVERPVTQGEAILATAVVDRNGCLVEAPAVAISSFGWGMPKALKGDLNILKEWPKHEKALTENLEKKLRRTNEEGEILPLDLLTITDAYNHLADTLGIPLNIRSKTCFAVKTYEYYKNAEAPEPLLLNSFFLVDLQNANVLFENGQATENLKRYLGIEIPAKRHDLLNDTKVLEVAVSPGLIPPARWPGSGRHPLVLLQQCAVNLALNTLKPGGIFAVNGPPGTGKTTLLRDIVAALVMQRAEAMCNFDNPVNAFTHSGEKLKAGQAWLHLYEVDKSLKGFEMVIASSNNKAVENVSAELPGIKAIADDAHDLRYFKVLSDTLLNRETWGLIAAVLGNVSNRSRFRQTFWWDSDAGLSTYLAEASGTPQLIEVKDEEGKLIETKRPRIIVDSDAPANPAEALQRWQIAREKYKQSSEKSRVGLAALEQLRQTVLNLSQYTEDEARSKASLAEANQEEARTKSEFGAANTALSEAKAVLKTFQDNLVQHLRSRPGFWVRLFKTATFQLWRKDHYDITEMVKKANKEHETKERILLDCDKKWKTWQSTLQACERRYTTVNNALMSARQKISDARNRLGPHLIDRDFFSLSHNEKHQIAPWCDLQMQKLRDELFVAAIKLHKAFIDASAKPLRHNLGNLMMVFSGKTMPDEEKTKLLPDLWSSLFLVVPAVSTTFASVERMFKGLPPETFGWLLIDEAGQALPQASVGAIVRAKRAIVVGDPMQIEPVVTLPDTLTKNICKRFGIDPNLYNAPEASTQTLADSATPYYAEFHTKFGSRFVGAPLLVHRRCAEPMFSISNVIAYEHLMVQAKQLGNSPIKDCLGSSRWIDIQGEADEKWCPQEGDIVLDLLRRLQMASINPNLYIVTPFVIVAENLRKIIRESGILRSWTDNEYQWCTERIGTVHTVQGREAEAVIFVLGAQDPGQAKARGWAGGKPNLLNVAVTRAKEVLYVVGNKQLWREAGLFRELVDRI